MRTARLRPGDVVEVDVRGRIFTARVVDLHPRDWSPHHIEVEALRPGCRGYRFVEARQARRRVERLAGGQRAA